MIGRQDEHHLVFRAFEAHRRQGDGGGGVPTDGLGHHPHRGQLHPHDAPVTTIGHDEDVLWTDDVAESVHRELEKRPLPEQRQERLWATR